MKKILNVFGMALFLAFLGMNVYSSVENPQLFTSVEALAQGTTGEDTDTDETGTDPVVVCCKTSTNGCVIVMDENGDPRTVEFGDKVECP